MIIGEGSHRGPNGDIGPPWESAYRRFETPEEEIRKFMRRLTRLGAQNWPRESRVIELFCGRGNGLHALTRLGFTHLEGVDLSSRLLSDYDGPAKLYCADCRQLPFPDTSRDIAIIHGGLHHLPALPENLDLTLSEIYRVLEKKGRLIVVEPWMTPFLSLVHRVCEMGLARRASRKIDALATMNDLEQPIYSLWLERPMEILAAFDRFFELHQCKAFFGKLQLEGIARSAPLDRCFGKSWELCFDGTASPVNDGEPACQVIPHEK